MSLFIKNIKKLVNARAQSVSSPLKGKEMDSLPCIEDAWLLTEKDRIARMGRMCDLAPESMEAIEDVADEVIFMDGGVIVEKGPARQVIEHPQEERTRQFLSRYAEN